MFYNKKLSFNNSFSLPPIARWNIGEDEVHLFCKEGTLAYSTSGRLGAQTPFSSAPYNLEYATNMALMFQRTIRENLTRDGIHRSCFLPLLCQIASDGQNEQLALFGRVSNTVENCLRGVSGRWAIFDSNWKEDRFLPIQGFVAGDFIRRAQGEEALDSCAMNAYVKRFSIVLRRDAENQIQDIFLKYQRSWYESDGKTSSDALIDFLSSPEEPALLEVLHQLGLAPNQISIHCEETEWACFRNMLQKIESFSKDKAACVFRNLENKYPTIFSTLLEETVRKNDLFGQDNQYESILTGLKQGVVAQDTAAEFLATAISSQRKNDGRAVFLFVGPTGVGKTEIAKVAASFKSNRFVKFDMDQYQGEVDCNKLFGAAMGYVGSTDEPLFSKQLEKYASPLSEKEGTFVRNIVDAVIVFDELEKAHSNVKQSLLTLFEEGYCQIQYSANRKNLVIKYIFNRCIFVCTSNLFKEQILNDFRNNVTNEIIAQNFIQSNTRAVNARTYSPELLGRMRVVPFGPIPRGELYQRLISNKLSSLLTELQAATNCADVRISEEDLPGVLRMLEERLYGDGTGVRGVKKFFELELKNAIYRQSAWGSLRDKEIKIVPLASGRLGLKCTRVIYGKVIQEYGEVSI